MICPLRKWIFLSTIFQQTGFSWINRWANVREPYSLMDKKLGFGAQVPASHPHTTYQLHTYTWARLQPPSASISSAVGRCCQAFPHRAVGSHWVTRLTALGVVPASIVQDIIVTLPHLRTSPPTCLLHVNHPPGGLCHYLVPPRRLFNTKANAALKMPLLLGGHMQDPNIHILITRLLLKWKHKIWTL